MGDMSEMRGLIVVGVFICTAVILILIMPSQFYNSTAPSQNINPKAGSFASELYFNESFVYNLTGSQWHNWGDKMLGGWHTNLYEDYSPNYHAECLRFTISDDFWGFYYNTQDFTWSDKNGVLRSSPHDVYVDAALFYTRKYTVISMDIIDLVFKNNWGTSFSLESSKCKISVAFSFPSNYSLPSIADADGALNLGVAIDFSERNTQINAWTLISSFLFFQTIPNLETTISLLIEAPLWIAEIYMIFIFVLRVIGAVFGGGGA